MAAEDRVPTGVLLLGPPGVGKRTLAEAFATRLLCESPTDGSACGTCRHCHLVSAGTHPDLRIVTRDEERRDIRTEQVRELARWLSQKALVSNRKIALIDEAHCLNEHGQNALLKTLEEPPGRAVLVLTARSAALLLPTVRSRCQILRLDPLPLAAVTQLLTASGLSKAQVKVLAPLAEGCPGRVRGLGDDDDLALRNKLREALPRLDALPAHEISKLAQDLSRGSFEVALSTAVGWYRDVLQAALLGDALPLRNDDVAAAVRAAAARHLPAVRLRQLEVVCDTLEALGRNANRMLALETMLLWLREIERGNTVAVTSWTRTP
jgi:DNA polymerase-3 subunit delta'